MTTETLAVPFLSDGDAEDSTDILQAAAALIQAAQSDSLAVVMCTHAKSGEEAAMLCAMSSHADSERATYVPLGMLFSPGNTPWTEFRPPLSGIAQDMLDD